MHQRGIGEVAAMLRHLESLIERAEMIGLELEHARAGRLRLVEASEMAQRDHAPEHRLDVLGLELQRGVELDQRLVEAARLAQHFAEIVERFGATRLGQDGALIQRFGFLALAELGQDQREIDQGRKVFRLRRQDTPIIGDGGDGIALRPLRACLVEQALDIIATWFRPGHVSCSGPRTGQRRTERAKGEMS